VQSGMQLPMSERNHLPLLLGQKTKNGSSRTYIFHPDDGGNRFLQNNGACLPDFTASYHRRPTLNSLL
jgi:hypothetical protein